MLFTFIETRVFTRLVREYLTDDEYAAVQRELIADPDAGTLIQGSGGLRKLRVAAAGRSIPAHVLRKIRDEVEDD
jgi:hypothetical protein